MSGTTSPCGETTNRISSATGLTSRLTAHSRDGADLLVCGPLSSSGSASASMRGASPKTSGRGLFGGLILRGRLPGRPGEIGLADPARLDARLHDQGLGVVA